MRTSGRILSTALLLGAWQADAAPERVTVAVLTPVPARGPALAAALAPELVIAIADPAGFDSKPLPADGLARLRGGTETVSSDMQLSGAVGGNTAVNVYTGANSISAGSFSNASGLPVAIQNSGANVLIQNATIINIQMQ